MGVDVGHIVKHSFRDYSNKEAVKRFATKTIEAIQKHYSIKDEIEVSYLEEDYDYPELELRVPGLDIIGISFHYGFWFIDTGWNYSQYTTSDFVRRIFFDITNALGETEGWSCDDYHSWNCNKFDIDTDSFDKWLNMAQKEGLGNYELEVKDNEVSDDCRIYYDNFKSLHSELLDLQKKYPSYIIRCLSKICDRFVRAEYNGEFYLIDDETGQVLTKSPIDGVYEDLNNSGFTIRKGELYQLIGVNGEQLSNWVEGVFEWSWYEANTQFYAVKIVNTTANISYIYDYNTRTYSQNHK